MKTMFPEYSKKHGFTLVEMTMTLMILGVLAAVILPKFFERSTFEERYFHDDLISAARYAQRLATGSGCTVRLSISGTGFSLVQDINCDLSSPSYTLSVNRPSDSEVFSNTNVPTGLGITASHAAYFFLPQGRVIGSGGSNVGNATIVLNGVLTRTINIAGATGYAYAS